MDIGIHFIVTVMAAEGYLEAKSTLAHMNMTDGVFPGKGSFAMSYILDRFPEKFELLYHQYSVLYRVK